MKRLVLGIAAATLVYLPSMALSSCGDASCSVGAAGTGGEKSDGKAQGFHEIIPSIRFPGRTITNSGNLDAGRLTILGGGFPSGTISGTFRENPEPTVRGHGTGIFGDWSGQCPEELIDAGAC